MIPVRDFVLVLSHERQRLKKTELQSEFVMGVIKGLLLAQGMAQEMQKHNDRRSIHGKQLKNDRS